MTPDPSKLYDPYNKFCNARYSNEELTSCLNGYYTINVNFCDVVFANRGQNVSSEQNYVACTKGYREAHPYIS